MTFQCYPVILLGLTIYPGGYDRHGLACCFASENVQVSGCPVAIGAGVVCFGLLFFVMVQRQGYRSALRFDGLSQGLLNPSLRNPCCISGQLINRFQHRRER